VGQDQVFWMNDVEYDILREKAYDIVIHCLHGRCTGTIKNKQHFGKTMYRERWIEVTLYYEFIVQIISMDPCKR
jgi:hypothetical protein